MNQENEHCDKCNGKKLHPFVIHNDPEYAKFVIDEQQLNLKEDEAIICFAMASGNKPRLLKKPAWKMIRFNIKGLTEATFEESMVWYVTTSLSLSAMVHGWTTE